MANARPEADGADDGPDVNAQSPPPTLDEWVPLVYDQLRDLAHRALRRESHAHSVTTTALVHEAYLKLGSSRQTPWPRAHFLGVAARAMRQVLVDTARTRRAMKRGGGVRPITLDDALLADERADGLLELDDALRRLEALSPRLARVVECRYFGGLTDAETAEALGVTTRTVRRDWIKAKGWLHEALRAEGR